MKKVFMTLALTVAAVSAKADGFVCQTEDGSLRVRAYNEVQADSGTRNPAVMVLSDPRVQAGRKTIAVFRASDETLENGNQYLANVDLRYSDISRGGEYLLGTRLMYIDTLALHVHFDYGTKVQDGQALSGVLRLVKRDGTRARFTVACERYLKN